MRARGCAEAPTYPHTDPVFGSDWVRISLAMQKQHAVLEFWQDLFSKLGSTFWVKIPVAWVVMTTEPENMKAILASSFADFPLLGPRKDSIASILGEEAIFAANGQAWHDARAMMRPAFVRNQLADLACFEKHVGNLIARIPKNGSTVDLQELLYMMTMDSATDFMFGHSTNMLTTPSAEASEYIQRVKHEEKDSERAYVFLYEMMGQGTSPEYVRAQLLSMILAGRDTTASTLSSLFWILARRPEVVARLRGEIEELGGRQPTWEEMKDMKYLNMVLKEVMRLYPTVASMSRGAARDTTLPVGGGPDGKSPVFVPKGSLNAGKTGVQAGNIYLSLEAREYALANSSR
ncbi:Cytochrome P450 52A5 [Colletotrichum sidae]|uniref:Cytochrome P450 52A5 n=1 Tax=Colletotrichum sidae TaxID=1347389 RepID=A0A4R8TCY5_9PEZI|nr:Cytochrome P450 52A5 [Colletotrichum sidae]